MSLSVSGILKASTFPFRLIAIPPLIPGYFHSSQYWNQDQTDLFESQVVSAFQNPAALVMSEPVDADVFIAQLLGK